MTAPEEHYALVLHEIDGDGPRAAEVVKTDTDPDALKTWYLEQLAPVGSVQGGQFREFRLDSILWNHRAAPDIERLNNPGGGIWKVSAGVQPGFRMVAQ